MLEEKEVENKLKDHDQKFKHLYATTDNLEKRVADLEKKLADLTAKSVTTS
jgi:phage shock protein A